MAPPRIDFYRLRGEGEDLLPQAVCRVVGKAYQAGFRTRVYAHDPELLADLDSRLWTYRPGSFIPHAREGELDPELPEPVVLSTECGNGEEEVLICASPPPQGCTAAFERVAEFVRLGSSDQEEARQRYRAYRQAGFELRTHDLEG